MILPKEIKCRRFSSETLIGWKSGKTTYVPLWDQMEGAWLWTQSPQDNGGTYLFFKLGQDSTTINHCLLLIH
jgi:hypothetical protein